MRPHLLASLFVLTLIPAGAAQLPLGADHPHTHSPRNLHRHPRVRQVDVEHVRIEIESAPLSRGLRAKVTIQAKALLPGLKEIHLDAGNLLDHQSRVNDVSTASFKYGDKLILRLEEPIARGESVEIEVSYRAAPEDGWLLVRRPLPGGGEVVMVHTQGQPEHHHEWFPCYDYPNDLATSELTVTAPPGYIALSNGVLVGASEDGLPPADEDGNRVFHWKQEQPHASYLITLCLGRFDSDHDEGAGVLLGYHVPAGQGDLIAHTFGRTPAMMAHFSELFGVAYPWPRYDQVVALGFESGGMENTGQTTLYEATVHSRRDSPDYSADTLIAHELAHQWWGDLVTCESWDHIWLHEGFATYYEALWLEHAVSRDAAAWDLHNGAGWYFGTDSGTRRPIVWNGYDDPQETFDALAYPKGAWVLHMLRHVVGHSTWVATLAGFLRDHAHRTIDTDDLQAAFDELHAGGVGWFFDQWLHGAGHPEYRVSQSHDAGQQVLLLTVEQAQKTDNWTPLFRMPVDIEIVQADGSVVQRRIEVAREKETFVLPCQGEPKDVRFDKGSWILKQLEFPKPTSQLLVQIETDDDVMGRRTAAEALIGQLDESPEVRAAVALCLRDDSSPELRAHIASRLGHACGGKLWQRWQRSWREDAVAHPLSPTTQAWARDQILEADGADADSRVRTAAIYALVNFPGDPAVVARVATVAESADKTYQRAAACRTLGRLGSLVAHGPILQLALETDTHREAVERAALRALARLGHEDLYQLAAERAQPTCYRELRSDALTVLEALGNANDPQIVSILLPHALDADRPIRTRSIALLGRYGHLAPELARARLARLADESQEREWPQRAQQAADALAAIKKKLEGK